MNGSGWCVLAEKMSQGAGIRIGELADAEI